MAEYKQYITQAQENGTVMIYEDVIATIVTQAVSDVEGVDGLSVKTGAEIVDLIGKKSWGKGMKILIGEDNSLTIDCDVIVKYNYAVVDVAKACQQAVANAIEAVTGIRVTQVNVNVCGIARQ